MQNDIIGIAFIYGKRWKRKEEKKIHQANLCIISGNLTLCEINLKFILNTALVFPKKIPRKCSTAREMKWMRKKNNHYWSAETISLSCDCDRDLTNCLFFLRCFRFPFSFTRKSFSWSMCEECWCLWLCFDGELFGGWLVMLKTNLKPSFDCIQKLWFHFWIFMSSNNNHSPKPNMHRQLLLLIMVLMCPFHFHFRRIFFWFKIN